MYAVTVHLTLAPDTRAAFLPLIRENATRSAADEPGCLRFDICTRADMPDTLFLYELYTDEAAFAAHKTTPHYHAFTRASAGMIATKEVQGWQVEG